MLKIIISRYALFLIMGVEALLLPYFLPKELYGEIEFYRYTAFLFQFLLFGSGTGYVVRALNARSDSKEILKNFLVCGFVHSAFVAIMIALSYSFVLGLLAFLVMAAFVMESILKTQEYFLTAMLFKPLVSLLLIISLPVFYFLEASAIHYIMASFLLSFLIFFFLSNRVASKSFIFGSSVVSFGNIFKLYFMNIKQGFIMNVATAMTFVFFYYDRTVIRNNYPELLADYSFSFAITQLAVVAISTFAYVNIVDFGKADISNNYDELKLKIYKTLRWCFLLFIVLGSCTLVFIFVAEDFYGFDEAFRTTVIIMSFFGTASVALSVNSAHLYLKSINVMASFILGALIVSFALTNILPHNSVSDYYVLLIKSYSIYFVFSITSLLYILFSLRKRKV